MSALKKAHCRHGRTGHTDKWDTIGARTGITHLTGSGQGAMEEHTGRRKALSLPAGMEGFMEEVTF